MIATTTPQKGLDQVKVGDYIGFKMNGNERCREVLEVGCGEVRVRGLEEGDRDIWVSLFACWRE